MKDGIINIDTARGKTIGFTSDRFYGYLWKTGKDVYISFIMSRARGNFRDLVNQILSLGLTVKVPTPLGRMQAIVEKNGYRHTTEPCEVLDGDVEVWVLEPKPCSA